MGARESAHLQDPTDVSPLRYPCAGGDFMVTGIAYAMAALMLPFHLVTACTPHTAASRRGPDPLNPLTLRADAGDVTPHDLEAGLDKVLGRHGYIVEWQDGTPGTVVFETQWRWRALFEDEPPEGIIAARTRLVIRCIWRRHRETFSLRIEAENMVQTQAGGGEWQKAYGTRMFEHYIAMIADDMRTELSSGIRVK